MKKWILALLIFILSLDIIEAQCLGAQSYTLNPLGPYSPGQTVTVTYTLSSFIQVNINWIHCFDLDLGAGWSSVTPISGPGNPGGSSGSWIWDNQHTYPSGINFGPGWRFSNTGVPQWGTSSTGPFTMSFQLTVDSSCTPQNLDINMEVYGDCQTGGWSNGACCAIVPYSIYSGNSSGSIGLAGLDNTINSCDSDSAFNMINQLGGNPTAGGTWYNSFSSIVSSTFDPSSSPSGTYLYIVPGSGLACPDDTAFLSITIYNSPIVNLPPLAGMCDNESPLTLSSGTPAGGTYLVNGNSATTFTPSPSNIGLNTITYNYTSFNGCTGSSTENIIVYESPYASDSTSNASCHGFSDGTATLNINGGSPIYTTNWYGMNPLALPAGIYGYTVTDQNNCSFSDSIIIYEPGLLTSSISAINLTCNGSNNGSAAIQLQGTSTPAGTISTLNYCTSTPGSNMTSTIDNVQLIGDIFSINNNTTGLCDQYEDYTTQYADITQGQAYTIDITLGDCSPNNYPSGAKVYIDWNIDGDFFDIGEHIGTIQPGPPGTTTVPFTVPFNGFGATRMRIVSQFLNNLPVDSIGPCDVGVFSAPTYQQPWFGATEDYSIVLSSPLVNATYLWSNGAVTDSIGGLAAGNYFVDITDNYGCTITDSVSIYQPQAITANTIITNVSCYGLNDGMAAITINGGIPNYTINVLSYSQTLLAGLNTFTTPPLLNAGTYYYSIVDSNNCILDDSITISSPSQIATNTNITSCDSYTWNGVNYMNTGIITDTLTANNGCDSIATLNLTIDNSSLSFENKTECDSYTWNGITYTTSGNYTYLTTNSVGCDSTASLSLTINYSTSTLMPVTSCDNYLWNITNQNYFNSGTYLVNSTNNSGCTHVDSLILLINYSNASYDTITSCNSYSWNNQLFMTSGNYSSTLINSNGCDSIANLVLLIADTTGSTISTMICDSFYWSTTGSTYTNTGIFTHISINANGCPNIDTLDLIILPDNGCTDSLACNYDPTALCDDGSCLTAYGCMDSTACNYDVLASCDDGSCLTAYGCTDPNACNYDASATCDDGSCDYSFGCMDSLACNYDPTALCDDGSCDYSFGCTDPLACNYDATAICDNGSCAYATTSTNTHTVCDSYNWNGSTYTTSGNYTYVTTNSVGCDSTATLNLVINNSSSSSFSIDACNEYTWDSITYIVSAQYTRVFTNSHGCDSTVLLNLTIIHDSVDITANIATNHISCHGSVDGNIQLFPDGGIPPYSYSWSNGETGSAIYDLPSGTYNFIIYDSLHCSYADSITITEPPQLNVTFQLTDDTICRNETTNLEITIDTLHTGFFTVIVQDSIPTSYVISNSGLLFPEDVPISLSPNYSKNIQIISLTDENGCSDTTTKIIPIIVHQLPTLNINLTDVCFGSKSFYLPDDLINSATPLGGNYLIDNITTDFFDVENLNAGSYKIKYEYTDSTTLCFNEIEGIININASPIANFKFSPQPTNMNDPNIYFTDNSNNIIGSIWDLGDGNIVKDSLNFWHTYNDTGKYIITYIVNNEFNCSDTIIDSLIINPIYKIFIPNAFTPNPDIDELNNMFEPNIIGANKYIMNIFNLWGEKIFESENRGWNGKQNGKYVQNGTYSYSILVNDFNNKLFKYTGTFHLIR